MGHIGGAVVDIMRGLPQVLKTRTDVWEVSGLDGYGSQTLGLGDAEYTLETIFYAASNDDANTFLDECEGLQGTIVTVIDDYGDSYDNVLVKHVDSTQQGKMPVVYLGNTNAVRVKITWTLLST